MRSASDLVVYAAPIFVKTSIRSSASRTGLFIHVEAVDGAAEATANLRASIESWPHSTMQMEPWWHM